MKPDLTTPIIGIEMHVELATQSKMFCGCPADHFGKTPNTQTCPVCLGLPGALPVPNKKAIDWTIMIGQALNCRINLQSKFDRKHYFYPDLPKGFQTSQYDEPFCERGSVNTTGGSVKITRAHLEEDTGKLSHTTLKGERVSLVDFNRSGVPLVEIVSEPDIYSSDQAKEYCKKVAQTIRFLAVSDADMEKGSMRLEANISWGLDLGYKVEVKNINSFNFLAKAIDYELTRQKTLLKQGKTPIQETRGWNETKGITFSQRSKEEAQDYRYFPEPNIPPIIFTKKQISTIKASMPQLPDQIQAHWQKALHLKPQYYDVLLAGPYIYAYTQKAFDLALNAKLDPDRVANAIVNKAVDIKKTSPQDLISKLKKDADKVTDSSRLEDWADQAIKANPSAVADYQAGKASAIQFLMGQIMKLSRGQASPPKVIKLLKQKLS